MNYSQASFQNGTMNVTSNGVDEAKETLESKEILFFGIHCLFP